MSESVTLYCKDTCENVEAFLKRLSMLNPTEIARGLEPAWTQVKCSTSSGDVQFTRQFFKQQADPFTKLRWKTIVKVRATAERNPSVALEVEKRLDATESIIGIVAEPGFDQIEKLPELIGFLAMELDALIFNGSEFLDFRGNSVLEL